MESRKDGVYRICVYRTCDHDIHTILRLVNIIVHIVYRCHFQRVRVHMLGRKELEVHFMTE
jgi:hypothetical protein